MNDFHALMRVFCAWLYLASGHLFNRAAAFEMRRSKFNKKPETSEEASGFTNSNVVYAGSSVFFELRLANRSFKSS